MNDINYTNVTYSVKVPNISDIQKTIDALQAKHPGMVQTQASWSRRVLKYGNVPTEDVYDSLYNLTVAFRKVEDQNTGRISDGPAI